MEYLCSSCHDLETDIQKQLKHDQQLGHDFNGLGGVVRQITNFGMTRNKGDYMLVAHKHKINYYKTTTIVINPFNFVSFQDLTAINFDTRVAFDFIGHVVSTEPMRVIKENARETRLMSIVAQDLSGRKMQVALWDGFALKLNNYILNIKMKMLIYKSIYLGRDCILMMICIIFQNLKRRNWFVYHCYYNRFRFGEGWYSFYCRDCSKNVTKNGDDSDGEPFNCNGCRVVSDVFGKVRVVIYVQDETGSASFILFDRHVKDLIHRCNHWLMEKISKDQGCQKIPDEFNTMLNRKFVFKVQISKFNLENNYHAYTIHKMTDDELVVGAVFKHSPAYEENNIHSDGTPKSYQQEKSVSVEGDNINVVYLDAVTPTSTSLKCPIEIATTIESFEWSSSKEGVAPHTLKIQKMEKLE
uniref:Replication factor A C-terminal domain-containing protein n=1 Tax=Lactuca sativa TaxID=4236 RepID=A0A9R1WH34_LACSA|nr:hypothetical protein LSAT_V11C200086030 [Lactuca sativa]